MRRYVVVRTDKGRASFMLREFEQGRLRQGWGWLPSQDLRLLRAKVNAGQKLTAEEAPAWRNRRLLDTEPDGLKPGDVVVVPNLPEQGRWVIARVAGPYTYAPPDPEAKVGADYAHVVAVAPIRAPGGKLAVIDPDNAAVDARLRSTMRNLSRMWSIDALGADWKVVMSDTFGESSFRFMLHATGEEFGAAAQSSDGWGGDHWVLAQAKRSNGTSGWAFAMHVVMDDAASAKELAAAFGQYLVSPVVGGSACKERKTLGPLAWGQRGVDLVIVAGPYDADGAKRASASNCAAAKKWISGILPP
jgi:hypothetical protein